MRLRTVKTASGKYAIQVVSKHLGILTVHKHIGSYENAQEKTVLSKKAYDFIQQSTGQISFLDHLTTTSLSDIIITQSRPLFAYDLFSRCYEKIGLSIYSDPLIKDLIISRIYHPASKRILQEYLHESLGRTYSLKTIYRHVKKSLKSGIKERYQKALISFAKEDLKDTLRLVFYDVITLYFDSHVKTTLKNFGFSKDHRPQDTQIVIGLVVNQNGFPLYFDTFAGNTFEGHTFVIIIENICTLLNTHTLIVVADAAMLSQNNIEQLEKKGIGFIVGARLANLPQEIIDQISKKIVKQDGSITSLLYKKHRLICEYSTKRAVKDSYERTKQITTANVVINNPTTATRRYRFVQKSPNHEYKLNSLLIEKAEKLEGIKGYVTNTKLDDQTIINRYHELWHIENSFRITKSDLEARPIFHRLEETIKAHMIIVFAELAIVKYIELATGMSIKKVLHICSKMLTHTLKNRKTRETIETETTIEDPKLKEVTDYLRVVGY